MKCLLCSAFAAFLSAEMSAFGVTVTVDKVQQRYPWNGIVDIDYTIAYDTGAAEPELDLLSERLVVTVVDTANDPTTEIVAKNLSPAPLATSAGQHRLSWNANADGVDFKSDAVTVKIEVRRYAAKYMVVDLSAGSTAKSYPISYLEGEPTGGFNKPEFKTDKMVFRLVPAGSFMMGSPSTEKGRDTSETRHRVVLSKPFYIGIFEVTQEQYAKVKGSVPVSYTGELRPVGYLMGDDVCGYTSKTATSAPSSTSFVGTFRSRTLPAFNLPTQAQWEYACRAGTTTPYNDGTVQSTASGYETGYTASMKELGRFSGNNTEGDFSSGPTTVGSFKPNGWGLYDMHGNVSEWCCDGNGAYDVIPDNAVDPQLNGGLCSRGGNYGSAVGSCRSASRAGHMGSGNRYNFAANGFRMAMTLE